MTQPIDAYHEKVQSGELRPDARQEAVMQDLQRLYNDLQALQKKKTLSLFKKKQPVMGLYIYGGVGRGKSMMMDLFYQNLPETLPSRRVHFHEFMISVHDNISQQSGHGYDRALPRFAAMLAEEVKLLCFDEFHVTDIADAMILGRLFTALFDAGMVVVSTSNWAPDDLYKDGLQRDLFLPFIDILKTHMEVAHLDSPTDYRGEFLAQEGRYFTPLGHATQEKMDTLFYELTGHTPPTEDKIEVKGRMINVHQVAGGIARFTFAQLCEQPHGAEDYLAIAKRYHTIFLENIPKLGYDRRNEAKRLMTLIDALYEAGTQLIISAERKPERLYKGRDHAFEFDRTISRLNEMQSADYANEN